MNIKALENPALLKTSPLLSNFTDEQLAKLLVSCHYQKLDKKQVLFLEHDEVNGFYIVVKGQIKISKISAEGKEHILHMAAPPQTFAEATMFDMPRFPANAVALEKSEVIFVPRDAFFDVIDNDPAVYRKLLSHLTRWIRGMTDIIYSLAFCDVESRIISYLNKLANEECGEVRNGCTFELGIEKATLASYLGTIPETFSRAIRKLQDQGIISAKGSRITIEDSEAFTRLLEDND